TWSPHPGRLPGACSPEDLRAEAAPGDRPGTRLDRCALSRRGRSEGAGHRGNPASPRDAPDALATAVCQVTVLGAPTSTQLLAALRNGRAIRYLLKDFRELGCFLLFASIPPDNNKAEASLRRVALG